ncbi:hypothetical protein GC197_16015 [bacterium]|nr:hypothetical protein [bacterium]
MFGVLKPDRSLLPPESRHRHASAYCGLCGLIGSQYGFTSRTMVVHDISTLWWILDNRLHTEEGSLPVVNCLRGGTRQLRKNGGTELQQLLAAISIFTLGTKVQDDLNDQPSWKTKALDAYFGKSFQRARRRLIDIGFDVGQLEETIQQQQTIENQAVTELDIASELTGKAYGQVAGEIAARCDSTFTKSQAENLGEVLGRVVYIVDAVRDFKKDRGRQYNPLCLRDESFSSNEIPHEVRKEALHFIGNQLDGGREIVHEASEKLASAWYSLERSLFAAVGVYDHQSVTLYSACCVPCGNAFVVIDEKAISGCAMTICCCYGVTFCGCTNWCC